MDLDDLFSAFDGGEKANNVKEAEERVVEVEKRKQVDGDEDAGRSKRQALPGKGGLPSDKTSGVGGAGDSWNHEPTGIVEGEESSTVRADGTLVKKFSVYPVGWKPDPTYRRPEKPAKVYPFTLDPFQKQAIEYIERNESVLVSAHTSAGKTVNAEYAIAKCLQEKQRVIYTSPIKALSNQKFRDLQEEFGDVGLMTGDITINPSATCLIMTTEILRSMLYRGSEVMREVAWVVYDEIHYMRDKNRGVVWEESIILLPHKVRFVFLSATIPNSKEFCGWIAKIHHQPCHVVYTDFRPVPLEHYIFPAGGDGLHLVVDNKGRFRENNFQRAMATLQATTEERALAEGTKSAAARKPTSKSGQSADLFKIVKLVMDRNLDPAIVFSFAKKECEANALQMAKLDFNVDEEKALVEQVFRNAMESLADEDRQLPQVEAILPLLKRGVGIHHGGLLPILKEVIEILFQEGLIKVLFATETFSIGLNMPARTVVFTSTRKFDGKDFRWISSGEYIQMSGRAGRRGKDDRGIVMQMLDEKMDPQVAKGILYGQADPLNSSYRISYNMLLNMLRVEDTDPEFLVKSSFHQYQQEVAAPALEEDARALDEEMVSAKAQIVDEKRASEYFLVQQQLERTRDDVRRVVQRPENCLPYIQVGRLLQIKGPPVGFEAPTPGEAQEDASKEHPDGRKTGGGLNWGWGAVVNLHKKPPKKAGEPANYEVEALVMCAPDEGKNRGPGQRKRPMPTARGVQDKGEMRCVPFTLSSMMELSTVRLLMPNDLRSLESRMAVAQGMTEAIRRFEGCLPKLQPVADMGIKDPSLEKLLAREKELQARMEGLPFHEDADRDEQLERYAAVQDIAQKAKLLRSEAKSVQHMAMKDEMRRKKRVLRRLGHSDTDGVIQLKGRFACEVNTCDEMLVTELVFSGAFSDLTPEQSCALLSCMVHQTKMEETSQTLPGDLQGPYRKLQEAARHVAIVIEDSKVQIDAEEYVNSFTPTIMEATFAWASGMSFKDVIYLTDEFEGSVIRVFRRLEELLRQLSQASGSIGNNELRVKFEQGADKIRRGIVFAASLYL